MAFVEGELRLVRVQVFHPQTGGIRMRSEGADRLDRDTPDDAGLRPDDLDVGFAPQLFAVGLRKVVPANRGWAYARP